ncbi:methyltransferase family protein [Nitrosococcus watsonii]|uniref:S-isoprenylcysteine methyltransferase-like protein n=1 Tax=Nitrosococcus watsoni (strain C-113) TaxID=105559 RepID=D8K7B0_NITWC|nr:isoprenylcysteine carboxylmethyltransferase family protein [Nitrosococcus watsonii]ADJ28787.1 S-isoprenylcysteine methyltransferase-like protein [Nitrosococcus watsonii C-113]
MSAFELIILGAYGLMVVELVFLPVPSEASTYQLLASKQPPGSCLSGGLRQAHQASLGRKLLVFLLPTGLILIAFLLPLGQIFFPQLKDYLWPIPIFETLLLRWVAIGLIISGSVFTLISVLEMRRGMTKNPFRKMGSELQLQGLFRWSRNPGLVGNYGLLLGLFCYFPSLVMALGMGIYLLSMHYRILLEESQLEIRFGEAYRAYQRRVPRYLGFLQLRD